MSEKPEPLTIAMTYGQTVGALLQAPAGAKACYVMAHGAGAGMAHPFMTAFANELALRIARAATGGRGIIATEFAYHGNTTALAELSQLLIPTGIKLVSAINQDIEIG